jgi:hypothetical protein
MWPGCGSGASPAANDAAWPRQSSSLDEFELEFELEFDDELEFELDELLELELDELFEFEFEELLELEFELELELELPSSYSHQRLRK